MKIQPKLAEEYAYNTNDQQAFISYYYQVKEVLELKAKSCLLIGQGDNIVTYILRSQGIEVDTFDIIENMHPTYVGDVRNIANIVNKKYDVVVCCEVLEHLPFIEIKQILQAMKEIQSKGIVLSLPIFGLSGYIKIWAPKFINMSIILSIRYYKPGKTEMCKQHYWEINSIGGPKLKELAGIIEQVLKIKKRYRVKDNPYHMMFVLET